MLRNQTEILEMKDAILEVKNPLEVQSRFEHAEETNKTTG